MAKTLSDFVDEALAIVDEMESEEARRLLDTPDRNGWHVIDVREPDEFQAGHIPGARNFPRGFLEVKADRQLARLDQGATDIEQALLENEASHVRWVEIKKGYNNTIIVRLQCSPLDVAPILKETIFDMMTDNWEGDTLEEYQMIQHIESSFSPDATTKIAVVVSDFRGHRARARMEDELASEESEILKKLIKQYSQQDYVFLAMQIGTRYLAEHVFDHSVWINQENFETAPLVLAEQIKKLILKYHRPAF